MLSRCDRRAIHCDTCTSLKQTSNTQPCVLLKHLETSRKFIRAASSGTNRHVLYQSSREEVMCAQYGRDTRGRGLPYLLPLPWQLVVRSLHPIRSILHDVRRNERQLHAKVCAILMLAPFGAQSSFMLDKVDGLAKNGTLSRFMQFLVVLVE